MKVIEAWAEILHKEFAEKLSFMLGILYSMFGLHPFGTALYLYVFLFLSSWGMMFVAEYRVNPEICSFVNYDLFFFTTATTVGFGTKVPVTWFGSVVLVKYIFFGGTTIILSLGAFFYKFIVKLHNLFIRGKIMLFRKEHIIVFSNNADMASKLSRMLVESLSAKNEERPIVVVTKGEFTVPSKSVSFFPFSLPNIAETVKNVQAEKAATIIICHDDDGIALRTIPWISSNGVKARVIVALSDMNSEETIMRLNPNFECTSSGSIGDVVRAAIIPGSIKYNNELNRPGDLDPQMFQVPKFKIMLRAYELARFMYEKFNVFPKYIMRENEQINQPQHDFEIKPGDLIVYDGRVVIDPEKIEWDSIPRS